MQRRKCSEEIHAFQHRENTAPKYTRKGAQQENQAPPHQAGHINFSGPGHDGPLSVIVSCLKKNPERKSVRDFGADEGI